MSRIEDRWKDEQKGTIAPQCNTCKNHIDGAKCKAFDVIPKAILSNEVSHKKPFDGDKGIRYTPA